MFPEEQELLKRCVALGEENNDILRRMQRSMRISRMMSILYWVFIIGTAFGAYYLIQPYLDQVWSTYNDARSQLDVLDILKQ